MVIIRDGIRRMYQEQEDVYYYITVMNENYSHPELPAGSEAGIIKGMYLFKDGGKPKKNAPHVQLLGSGTILRESFAAQELLEKGQTAVVLQYFGLCTKFWKMENGKLAAWTATVKGGDMPNFGANLLY